MQSKGVSGYKGSFGSVGCAGVKGFIGENVTTFTSTCNDYLQDSFKYDNSLRPFANYYNAADIYSASYSG